MKKFKFHNFLYILSNSWHQSKLNDLPKSDILLVRHDNNCGFEYEGKMYAQILDSVIDAGASHGISFVTIAKPFSRGYGARAYNQPFIFNRSFFFALLSCKIISFLLGRNYSEKYKKKFNQEIWARIIRTTSPKLVIAIQPCKQLCAAAKSLGVKVYDYQHGIISPDHRWYGKELLEIIDKKELPDGIILWDENSKNSLTCLAEKKGVELITLGNPWFERFVFPEEKDELVKQVYGNERLSYSPKPKILVSLQWGLAEHYYNGTNFNGIMCDALVTAIKKTHNIYNWHIRLHPVQLHGPNKRKTLDLLETLFNGLEGIEWTVTSEIPLPVLLKDIDLHVTDMSTVVTEAAWFGVRSAILNPFVRQGHKLERVFQEERITGVATVLDQSEDDILTWVVNNLGARSAKQFKGHKEELKRFLLKYI